MSTDVLGEIVATALEGRAVLQRASRLLESLGRPELAAQTQVVGLHLERSILVPFATRCRQRSGTWPELPGLTAAALELAMSQILTAAPDLSPCEVALAVGRQHGRSSGDSP